LSSEIGLFQYEGQLSGSRGKLFATAASPLVVVKQRSLWAGTYYWAGAIAHDFSADVLLHRRKSAWSPLYRFSAMQLMSACAGEPKFCTIFFAD
jgi:hypothetical protein